MGTVWLAHDQVLDRPVAVKEVAYPTAVSPDERALLAERTMREARAAARLSSPRTTTVHDVVDEGDRPWIVMEYVESRTLGEVLKTSGPLSPQDVARIGLDVLDALEAAHSMQIVHRDVKPGNVLLDGAGRAWLTDFGIATSAGEETLSDQGVLLGSPSFMAPERARGDEAGPFTDLFSLGATLYAAVEGQGPFDRGEPMATLLAVTTEPPRPPQRAGPLGPVLLGLLEKEPGERLTGWQARAALRDAVELANRVPAAPPTSPPPTSVPPTQSPPAQPPPRAEAPNAGDSVARIDRQEIKRLASLAGKSVAKGAARAAVAGLSAWREQAAKSNGSDSRRRPADADIFPPAQPDSPPAASLPTPPPPAPSSRGTPARSTPRRPLLRRPSMRLPALVASLIAVGLVLGVALLVLLIVVAVH
jgi:serine/threonine protein kinase